MNYRTFFQYFGTGLLLSLLPLMTMLKSSPAQAATEGTTRDRMAEQHREHNEIDDNDRFDELEFEGYDEENDYDSNNYDDADDNERFDGLEFEDYDDRRYNDDRDMRETSEAIEMPVDTYSWSAWLNRMPGVERQDSLYVKGRVQLPNPGYTASLEKADDQNYDRTLILELNVEDPAHDRLGELNNVSTSVNYEEESPGMYDRIAIRGEDGSILQTFEIQPVY